MENYTYIKLRERPELKQTAAEWFHSKWGVPTKAYLDCMNAYLAEETEYGWYAVLYNRMMVYVENHAYRATPDKEAETNN